MSEKTPVERAADALSNRSIYDTPMTHSRKILTAAVEDREGLSKILEDHRDIGGDAYYACQCGWPPPSSESPAAWFYVSRTDFTDHQADAVARWMTGGGS